MISSTKSELLAVDEHGLLYGWPWNESIPPTKPHPRSSELGLEEEAIKLLSGKVLRATVVTESGKIATWLDRSVARVGHIMEHPATLFTELLGDMVVHLTTSELFTAVCTDTGKIQWWYVICNTIESMQH